MGSAHKCAWFQGLGPRPRSYIGSDAFSTPGKIEEETSLDEDSSEEDGSSGRLGCLGFLRGDATPSLAGHSNRRPLPPEAPNTSDRPIWAQQAS